MNRALAFIALFRAYRNPLGVLALALVGCSGSPLFPVANQHPANWERDHGPFVISAGGPEKAHLPGGPTCVRCHSATRDAAGGIPPSHAGSSTCFTCHSSGPNGNPHPDDWKNAHGPWVRQSGGPSLATIRNAAMGLVDQRCDRCHSTGRQADGRVPASPRAASTCYSCHDSGPNGSPHPGGWLVGHQLSVRAAGSVELATISAPGLGVQDQACATCHTTRAEADGSVALSPHAASTCFSCHELRDDGAPHPARSAWISEHGLVTQRQGGYAQAFVNEAAMGAQQPCSACHTTAKAADGTVPSSPMATTTCYTCHYGPTGYSGRP